MRNIVPHTLLLLSICYADLINPVNEYSLNYIHIPFEWGQEPDAVAYNIQVSESDNFNSLTLDASTESTMFIDRENIQWDESYYWRVRPIYSSEGGDYDFGAWIGSSSFSVGGTLFSDLSVDSYQPDLIQDGYVAIGAFAPDLESVIIDVNGYEIWNDKGIGFQLNHINEYGNIYGFSVANYPLNTGMKGNMDMDVVWSTMDPNNPVDTHEIKQLPNGNYMAFIREDAYGPIPSDNYMTQYFQMLGYQADGVTPEFLWYGQKIVEWDENHDVVWSWSPFDHFTMQDYDNYEGTWYNAYFNQEVDWMHSNAFHFDEEESVIYVSHRHLSRISKIDYPSGEVIWNMGLPVEYMSSGDDHICTDLLFSFQHNIQMLDNGDLIFFDNGNLSDMLLGDSEPTSRIRRIRVIDNSYCETVWQYDLPPTLFGLGMGSVQQLDNGNFSIYSFGNGLGDPECSVFEITSNGDIVWKATGNPNTAWYRSYKVPSLHPQAFSVTAPEFKIFDGTPAVALSNNTLDFIVYNESGYTHSYEYTFSNNSDNFFDTENGQVTISPFSSDVLSFTPNPDANGETSIELTIFPFRHEYAEKIFTFDVLINQVEVGDINSDGTVNVVDIVLAVNIVLDNTYNQAADINNDGVVNVIDIVLLVNLILGY